MRTEPSEITRLRNLGPYCARVLGDAGIRTEAELRALGSVNAFRMVIMAGHHRVSLNLLYAVEAALRGVHWNSLPAEVKAELRREVEKPWDVRELTRQPVSDPDPHDL